MTSLQKIQSDDGQVRQSMSQVSIQEENLETERNPILSEDDSSSIQHDQDLQKFKFENMLPFLGQHIPKRSSKRKLTL
jgi:hypothetical protein